MAQDPPPPNALAQNPLREVAGVFLRLGTFAFGGPAAHIALMEDWIVRERGWLSREDFLDLLGATNFIPGPNSTEMAIHIGYRRAGWAGLIVAGVCFITPAVLIVGTLAWAYVRYGQLPAVAGLLYGVKPIVVAIVVQALFRLGRSAIKSAALAAIAAACLLATCLRVHELLVLLGGGLAMMTLRAIRASRATPLSIAYLPLTALATQGVPPAANPSPALVSIVALFLKIGSVLFGSGYVLLAFLQTELVDRRHWISQQQLLDAVAVGQVTPGPLFTTATFVGYLLGGPRAALAATVGIFLPAFVFVALSAPLVPRLRRSRAAGAFLDGLNVASLALIAVVTWQLGVASLVDPLTLALAVLSAVILLAFKPNATWLILLGATVGIAHALWFRS